MDAASPPPPDADHARQLRKAVIASTIGTTIEWYDFFLYSTAAGLVFGRLYFPHQDHFSANLLAFGTFFAGFAARPIGAAIFGHYGDRIGRKATLIVTLLFMGIATFLIAFVPPYETIGIWGAVILTVLRVLQGIGVGGQWGGSILLAMEWARSESRRGLVASWPQLGVPLGLFLANLMVLVAGSLSGSNPGPMAAAKTDTFLTWSSAWARATSSGVRVRSITCSCASSALPSGVSSLGGSGSNSAGSRLPASSSSGPSGACLAATSIVAAAARRHSRRIRISP